jgi:hypothetical protein
VKTSTILIIGAVGVAGAYYFFLRPGAALSTNAAKPVVATSAAGVQTLPNQPTDPGDPNNFLSSFLGSVLPGATSTLTGALNSGLSSISGASTSSGASSTLGEDSTDTSSYDSNDYDPDSDDSSSIDA